MTSRRFPLFLLLASLWSFCSLSFSQVTVTANLTDGTGTTYRTAYLHFQLVNCGQNVPVVTGQEVVVQDSFDLRPATPGGSISGTVLGNDQITCGGIASTNYVVTPMKDAAHPLRDGAAYVICSSASTLGTCGNPILGTFNLVTALPMTQVPPTPGLIQIYGNPTKTQTLDQPNGTEMNFQGTMNFCSATVLCGGNATNQSFYESMFYGSGTPSPSTGGPGSYYLNLAASPVQIWQNNFGQWSYSGIAINSGLVVHSTNYNAVTGDAQNLLIFNGTGLTATLPASLVGLGNSYFFLNESTSSLTVAGNGHTISGNATATIPAQSFMAVTVNAAGTQYYLNSFITLLADAGGNTLEILGNAVAFNSADGSQIIAGAPFTGGGFYLSNSGQTAKIQNLGDNNITITGNTTTTGNATISGSAAVTLGLTVGGNATVTGNLIVNTVATSPSTSPICPNGTGGAFTTVGCAAGSGVSGSGTPGLLAVWTGGTSLGNSSIAASSSTITFGSGSSLTGGRGILELNQFNGSGSTCTDSVSIPISLSSCSGFEILDQAAPTSNLGYMAGLSVVAQNTQHNTSKLIGIYVNASASSTSGTTTTDEYGGYIFADEGVTTTITNRHGLYVLAYNDTPNTSALNEGLVAQTGGNGGTTNTLDYTIHILAPANGDTLTTHVGIEVDAQGTGVPFQLKPQAFSTLPACSATYEGSHASVNDSTTATWGATIAGSSTHHVSAYCDGTNWTVEGS